MLASRLNLKQISSRSREGAWIEIALCVAIGAAATVAPVRERGLKWCLRG